MTRWMTLLGFFALTGMLVMFGGCDLGSDAEDEEIKTEVVAEATEENPDEEVAAEETPNRNGNGW